MKQIILLVAIAVCAVCAVGQEQQPESIDSASIAQLNDGCNACPLNCVENAECPARNPDKPVFLAHSDCTRYYVCETGRACEMNCPPGLHFNVREWVCDYPHSACCDPLIECVPGCVPGVTCPPTN